MIPHSNSNNHTACRLAGHAGSSHDVSLRLRAVRTFPVMRRGGVARCEAFGFVVGWVAPTDCCERLRRRVGCVRVYLAGPPPVAARRDRNRFGEFRAMRQLVGCRPAELEEIADVPDADQPVSGPPGLPGGSGGGMAGSGRAASSSVASRVGAGRPSQELAPGGREVLCLYPVAGTDHDHA